MNLKKLIPLYVGAAMGPIGAFGIVTVLPVMAKSWSVEFATASFAITLYMIPFIAIQIFSGTVAQLYDVRKTLLFGFLLYAVGAVLSGLSSSIEFFLVFRIISGIGAGFLTPVIMGLIGEIVPEDHMGKAIGMLGVAYTAGVTLGPFLSGVIDVHLGWSWFFYFLAAVALITGLLYFISSEPTDAKVPVKNKEAARVFDIVPVLKKALHEPGVLYTSFAAFFLFMAYIGVMTFTADYLKSTLHLASDRVGTVLSVTGFSGIIVSPLAGFVGDRIGRKKVFLIGTAIAILAIFLMILTPFSFGRYLILFLLLGIGAATAWTSLNTMAVQLSSSLRQPVTSVYNSIKFTGYALAPAVFALLYTPFKLNAVLMGCIIAVIFSSVLAIVHKREPAQSKTLTKGHSTTT